MTKEFYEVIEMFEKHFTGRRLDKEDKARWKEGIVYQHGELNELFKAFRLGYYFGKSV
jgi:hypothetical protein